MKLNVNPEFGVELALAVPYAYWLHQNGELESVRTSRGMRPFYYFCEDVREEYPSRSIDNIAALPNVPNQWIHHNSLAVTGRDYSSLTPEEQSEVNGVLDYSKWTPVPLKEHYRNDEFKFKNPTVFITNKYNIEHGEPPMGFFDIECLYEMFVYLRSRGYSVVYKRATNREKEFSLDFNEEKSLRDGYHDIQDTVDGFGVMNDFQLAKHFDNVMLMDDLVAKSGWSYNEAQIRIMANCERFISVCGGNSILSSMFGGTVISYIHKGKELRKNYFGKNSYFRKLSGANVIPVIDHTVMVSGEHDYFELKKAIKENF